MSRCGRGGMETCRAKWDVRVRHAACGRSQPRRLPSVQSGLTAVSAGSIQLVTQDEVNLNALI